MVLVLSMVASFETTKWLASLWPGSVSGVGIIVLGTVAFGVWALASSLLLFVFKSVLVGDFRGSLPTGEGCVCVSLSLASALHFVCDVRRFIPNPDCRTVHVLCPSKGGHAGPSQRMFPTFHPRAGRAMLNRRARSILGCRVYSRAIVNVPVMCIPLHTPHPQGRAAL